MGRGVCVGGGVCVVVCVWPFWDFRNLGVVAKTGKSGGRRGAFRGAMTMRTLIIVLMCCVDMLALMLLCRDVLYWYVDVLC